jgi:RNA polymerase sigma factor (sigma-70 family)
MKHDKCNNCGNTYVKTKKCWFCRPLYEKDWRRLHPSKHRLYLDRKRANTPKLTQDQKNNISAIYELARAKTLATGVSHHVDHILPVSKGGEHVPENLQVIPATENLKKSNKGQYPYFEYKKGPIELTDQEILKLCQTLARKYKNQQEYDDLVSEGIVACYECRDEGKGYKKDYVGAARRAMNDYINIKTKAMSVPDTWPARTVSHAMSTGEDLDRLDGVTSGTLKGLMDAMANDTVNVEELEIATPDHAHAYEKLDYESYVMSVAVTTLDKRELHILHQVYYKGKGQEELSDELEVSEATISRWKDGILHKIKQKL